jgi:uncharacterized protein (DUF1810 family)
MVDSYDRFDLLRFLLAERNSFDHALSEIRNGHKLTRKLPLKVHTSKIEIF